SIRAQSLPSFGEEWAAGTCASVHAGDGFPLVRSADLLTRPRVVKVVFACPPFADRRTDAAGGPPGLHQPFRNLRHADPPPRRIGGQGLAEDAGERVRRFGGLAGDVLPVGPPGRVPGAGLP